VRTAGRWQRVGERTQRRHDRANAGLSAPESGRIPRSRCRRRIRRRRWNGNAV